MKEWYELKSYRKKYERFYGIKVPDNYDIHHLNMNREDNSITNLIAIPRELHQRYHYLINSINQYGCYDLSAVDLFKIIPGMGMPFIDMRSFSEIYGVSKEVSSYVQDNYPALFRAVMANVERLGLSIMEVSNL